MKSLSAGVVLGVVVLGVVVLGVVAGSAKTATPRVKQSATQRITETSFFILISLSDNCVIFFKYTFIIGTSKAIDHLSL